MTNLPALAARLTEADLMDVTFRDMNKDQVEAMCQAVFESLEPVPYTMPYFSILHREPVLIIPDSAPPDLKPWPKTGYDEGRKVLFRVLRLLRADDDMMRRYMGEDWKEDTKDYESNA